MKTKRKKNKNFINNINDNLKDKYNNINTYNNINNKNNKLINPMNIYPIKSFFYGSKFNLKKNQKFYELYHRIQKKEKKNIQKNLILGNLHSQIILVQSPNLII